MIQNTIGQQSYAMRSTAGNLISNQTIVPTQYATYFKSYQSIIVRKCNLTGAVLLDTNLWACSSTTSKYRNIFLNETTMETRKKIKSGEYTLVDLNKKD